MYSYLKQTKNVILFFFYKITEQEGGTGPVRGVQVEGEEVGKGCRTVNIIQILCTHV
jgi:hypothetical protein